MDIFDAHHHIGSFANIIGTDRIEEQPGNIEGFIEQDYRVRIKTMEDNGIHKAVLMPTFGYSQPDGIKDTKRINDSVAAYRARDPQRFPAALGTVELSHGDRSIDEIDRIKNELHLNGIVWHHRFQGHFIDSPIMRTFLRRMSNLKLIPFIHTFGESTLESVWQLEMLAEEFPQIVFVDLCGFSSFSQGQHIFQIARRRENILFDTAVAIAPHITIRNFVESFGSERLLFGSDLYSSPLGYQTCGVLEEILRLDISNEAKTDILGRNLERLLQIS